MDKERRKQLMDAAVQEYITASNNNEWISLGELHEKYGFKRQTIAKYIKLAGGTIENHTSGKSFDYKVFDIIDTEEKAYWLGFLYADGCVTNNSVEFGVILSDYEIMQKYRRFLKLTSDASIKTSNNVCRVRIHNKHFAEALINKGCVPRKSLILKFPTEDIVDKSLIKHFIRGYCDGDGCLRFYKNHKSVWVCDLTFCGTKELLEDINKELNVPGGYLQKTTNNNTYHLCYRCVSARKVARILYENANIYLNRKYKIYESFCRFEEQSSNAKSSKIGESCDANTEVSFEITKGSETP